MKRVTVIGLGYGELEQIPLGIYRFLKETSYLYTRTIDHPIFEQLQEENIQIESFDTIYEENETFEAVYETIVKRLLEVDAPSVVYAVPGHPLVAEQTVQLLIEAEREGKIELDIKGGQSFLDAMFTAVRMDPIEGFQLVDALQLKAEELVMSQHILIGQVYDAFVASEVKLTLMEKYRDDYEVKVVTAAGTSMEQVLTVPIYELDRVTQIDNLTSVYVPPAPFEERMRDWSSLKEVIRILRSPEGCPWDRKQTHESLKRHLIEEAHEVIQAIEEQDDDALIEELGDILLQVFLHAQIGEDEGYFVLEDIVQAIQEKMIRRHPHVFGDTTVENADDVVANWEEIKRAERGEETVHSILDGEYRASSSLLTSYNYQKKAATLGFNWPSIDGALEKFEEEWAEFLHEVREGNNETQIDEFGDVLFTLVKIAQFLKISPEEAMVHANEKFSRRFRHVERRMKENHAEGEVVDLEQMDLYWDEAKGEEQR